MTGNEDPITVLPKVSQDLLSLSLPESKAGPHAECMGWGDAAEAREEEVDRQGARIMDHGSKANEFRVKRSILRKTTLYVTGLVFLSVLVNTFFFVRNQSQNLRREVIHAAYVKAGDIVFATENAFWNHDWIFLEKMLTESPRHRYNNTVYIKIVNPDGEVYLANKRLYYGQKISPSLLSPEQDTLIDNVLFPETHEKGMLLIHPFTMQDERWHVLIAFSLRTVEQAMKDLIFTNLAWAALVILASVMGSFLLSRSLTRPIRALASAARTVARGKGDFDPDISSKDEVGLLSDSFSRMVSTMKAATSRLGRSENRYKSLLDTASKAGIGIALIQNDGDRKGLIKYVNEGMVHLSGYSKDELLNMPFTNLLHPDSMEYAWQLYTQPEVQGKPVTGIRIWGKTKKGERIPVEVTSGIAEFDDRKALVCYVRDVTDKVKAEERLKDYSENLEKIVKERTRDLKKAQEELVSRALDAGRAQLGAIVLHNIGNAMTPVKVVIESARKDEFDQLTGYLEKCCLDLFEHRASLTRYVNHDPRGKEVFAYFTSLVDSLKEYGRKRANTLDKIEKAISYVSETLTLQQTYGHSDKETKQQTFLNVLIEDAVRMYAGSFERRGIAVRKDLRSERAVLIDKNRLMQVVLNLIKNACEAIDELDDEDMERVIRITTFEEHDRIGLAITDTGIGLDPDQLEELFELSRSSKGSSGFGLYYSKLFVESNEGAIGITSPGKGKGATVSVTFPL